MKKEGSKVSVQWGELLFSERRRRWRGERVRLCNKEVSEIKYQTDLFILQQGGRQEGLRNCWGSFQHWGTVLGDVKAGEIWEHKCRRKKQLFIYFFHYQSSKQIFFFSSVGRGGLWVADFFSLFSPSLLFFSSLFSLFFNRCKNDWNPSRPHYCGPPENRAGA